MKQTVESKTAQAVLQSTQEVNIAGEIYHVSPASIATLILASEAIAELPDVNLDPENIVRESLYIAKDCSVLGDIIAILILGAKNLKGTKSVVRRRFFGLVSCRSQVVVDNKRELADKIRLELSPRQISDLATTLLSGMELAFFFGITTSLIGINLLRPTKHNKTTASGQL